MAKRKASAAKAKPKASKREKGTLRKVIEKLSKPEKFIKERVVRKKSARGARKAVASPAAQKKKPARTRKPRAAELPPKPRLRRAARKERVAPAIALEKPRVINHSQEREVVAAGSSKFEIESKEYFVEPRYVAAEKQELPLEYGDTKIVLLVRDPEWVFAYWEIAPAVREGLGIPKGKHSKPLALRVYDVTGVDFDGTNAVSFLDVPINDYAVSWYLRVPEANRTYCADLGLFTEQGEFLTIARSNVVATPRPDVSWETDEEWMSLQKEHFMELFRLSGGFAVKEFAGSEMMLRSLAEAVKGRLEGEQWGGSGAISSAAARPKAAAEKGFWMVVDTELIVYGATVPGSRVTIEGQDVALRADGTFSVRYALRDGERRLGVRAESADREDSREVTIHVTRKTK